MRTVIRYRLSQCRGPCLPESGNGLYNRHVIRTSFLAAALLLAGCAKKIDTTDAVRQGVMDYMSSIAPKIGLDMNNMQVDVSAVSFEHDHARATVSVTPKVAGSKGMELIYELDRKDDKWVVHGNAMSAGSTHGQEANSPPQAAPDGTPLPPGHPATGDVPPGTQLPPGHPAVPSSGTSPSSGTKP
jgi:hypothetical protein